MEVPPIGDKCLNENRSIMPEEKFATLPDDYPGGVAAPSSEAASSNNEAPSSEAVSNNEVPPSEAASSNNEASSPEAASSENESLSAESPASTSTLTMSTPTTTTTLTITEPGDFNIRVHGILSRNKDVKCYYALVSAIYPD
ncbi:hypothetical protein B7494_g5736 [Chlorociboria aeruginascens]|nr:hypothetical protein B7494_g5736 [Chlorociboria aeruginascens]